MGLLSPEEFIHLKFNGRLRSHLFVPINAPLVIHTLGGGEVNELCVLLLSVSPHMEN